MTLAVTSFIAVIVIIAGGHMRQGIQLHPHFFHTFEPAMHVFLAAKVTISLR